MKPHNYVDDVCADCGHVKAYKGTITFDDTAKRTEFTTAIQVWEENGVIVTNNKGSSTTNVADFSDPARFYKNSELIVAFPDMISLVFNTKEGAGDLASAIGANAKVDGNTVIVTFTEPQNSLSVVLTDGKVFVYSITAIVAHECVYDNACDADCNKCGATREVGDHTYTNDFDTDCNVCGAVRSVVNPIAFDGKSVSEDVSGLAFKFNLTLEGVAIKNNTWNRADFTNATMGDYKVIRVGAIATNGKSSVDIAGVHMCEFEGNHVSFAFRVINIPESGYDTEITMTPYIVLEIDGVETTIEGEPQTASYNQVANV